MRHDALQGPVTSISVGLSAMEAGHGPCGNGRVVDDRDDHNAPGVLAIRAASELGDNQPLDIVLGLRKFFHNRTTNRLGLPDRSPPVRNMWGDRRKNSMADRDSEGAATAVAARCRRCRGAEAADCRSGLPFGPPPDLPPAAEVVGFCRSQPTGGSCVGNDGEMRLRTALNEGAESCRTSPEANGVVR